MILLSVHVAFPLSRGAWLTTAQNRCFSSAFLLIQRFRQLDRIMCPVIMYTAIHWRPDYVHHAHWTRLPTTYRDLGGFLVQRVWFGVEGVCLVSETGGDGKPIWFDETTAGCDEIHLPTYLVRNKPTYIPRRSPDASGHSNVFGVRCRVCRLI